LQFRVENYDRVCDGNICNHHKREYLDYYSRKKLKCCDPLKIHKKNVKTNLRIISTTLSDTYYKVKRKTLIPGEKLCRNCENIIKHPRGEQEKLNDNRKTRNLRKTVRVSALLVLKSQYSNLSEFEFLSRNSHKSDASVIEPLSEERRKVTEILTALDIPPLEKNKLSNKRLEIKARQVLATVQLNMIQKINKGYGISIQIDTLTENLITDSASLRDIISSLQTNYSRATTYNEKLRILSLLPGDWLFPTTKKYFNCSRYLYQQAIELKSSGGNISKVNFLSFFPFMYIYYAN